MLNIALPKGRLGNKVYELFEKIAILRENFNDSQKAIIDDFFKKDQTLTV